MSATRSMIIVAVLVIALGIGWLLNTLGVIPGVDWLWTGGLGVAGILIMAAHGIGSFLLVSSVFSVLRQTGSLRANIEMPVLFIIFGGLLLLSLLLPLAPPEFLREEKPDDEKK